MSWLKHGCGRVLLAFFTRRWPGKAHRLVAIAILSLLPTLAISALGSPPESSGVPTPGITPEKPLGSGASPTIPPSQMDPGMQHVPEKRGDSRATVKPPNLDPGISKNPDVAPPANKGTNPSGGEHPKESQTFGNEDS